MDLEQALLWHDKNCHGEALQRIKSRQAVACMKREIDRLRAELVKVLERNKRQKEEIKKLVEYGFGQDKELNRLGVELAKAQEERDDISEAYLSLIKLAEAAEARCRELEKLNRILELKNKGSLANNLCPDHRDKQYGKPCLACEIERLEIALSGKTFSYDPDSYQKGFIAGMEEAAVITDNVKYNYGSPSEAENAVLDAYEAIRAHIEEVKNER